MALTSLLRRAWIPGTALVLCAVASGCGKSITVGDSAPPAPAAPNSATSARAPEASGQSAGNNALQVVNSTAAEDGKTGTGGTATGVQIQETRPCGCSCRR